MDSLPASPIRVTATVTMINDEGGTGTRTVTFETAYEEDEESEAEDASGGEEPPAEPTAKIGIGAFKASAGALTSISADRASVTMTNDEGQTATNTLTFQTTYERTAATTPTPSEPSTSGPTAKEIDSIDAPAGTQVDIYLKDVFDNTGTNPRFTGWLIHSVAAANYYRSVQFGWPEAVLDVTVKSAADLATYVALGHPTPLTSKSTVTMTNDEGQTAKATLTLKTTLDPN
ncbi:MAG: hypothetical protein OXE53_18030 [Deltaproteobacteria bacterium]|nr:hypothetical protein [Deltaproteobacteria bacterium]